MMPAVPYPPTPTSKQLAKYWTQPVQNLVQVTNLIPDEMQERHRLYSHLVMALVVAYWNGDSQGRAGKYHWRKRLGPYRTYIGHNIASIAVNVRGEVMAFDFNHNDLFNSSVEHAEARLIRHVFSLSGLDKAEMLNLPRLPVQGGLLNALSKMVNIVETIIENMDDSYRSKRNKYNTSLRDVTIYTSLESCAQCSGIMALAYVKQVVFLQEDPDQHCIGNILYNLMDKAEYPAPLPIPAGQIGLTAFANLNKKYKYFTDHVSKRPFFTHRNGKKDCKPSITSFLCTDEAYRIFANGGSKLNNMSCKFPTWKPSAKSLTNKEVLDHVRNYFRYAIALGNRGTPFR